MPCNLCGGNALDSCACSDKYPGQRPRQGACVRCNMGGAPGSQYGNSQPVTRGYCAGCQNFLAEKNRITRDAQVAERLALQLEQDARQQAEMRQAQLRHPFYTDESQVPNERRHERGFLGRHFPSLQSRPATIENYRIAAETIQNYHAMVAEETNTRQTLEANVLFDFNNDPFFSAKPQEFLTARDTIQRRDDLKAARVAAGPENDEDCAICLEPMTTTNSIPTICCAKYIHIACLRISFNACKKCPLCVDPHPM